jgi:hypothetical protein
MHPLRVTLAIATLVVAATTVSPAPASGSITIGSDLRLVPSPIADTCILSTPPCTEVLAGAHDGNRFSAASPTDGTVTSFGIRSAAADTVTFRLARLNASTKATGAGTGPTTTLPGRGKFSFPAHLRVHVGDVVGVDTSSVSAYPDDCPGGGFSLTYHPTLVDGGPFRPIDANGICELLVNAKVQPANSFELKTPKRNQNNGTAKLPVLLPGPGRVAVSGKGVKGSTERAPEAGKVKLPIKPRGKVKRHLRNRGKVKVKAKITFRPVGGHSRSESKTVKLIRR